MSERTKIIREQTKAVMPLIGGLLDAWDDLPNDVKCDWELERVARHIQSIDDAMEGE
uniref:Uncharacterized protein n=1 Tax=viral metagenome TaxID=1070528 RepID=A0A6H1ZSG7_9ZZZZ